MFLEQHVLGDPGCEVGSDIAEPLTVAGEVESVQT